MAEIMRAWHISSPGPFASVLALNTSAPRPSDAALASSPPGSILVQVLSAGLNPADHKIPEMGCLARLVLGFPKTPGMDLCGRVVAIHQTGGTSGDVKPGDIVIGRLDPMKRPGSLQERVILKPDEYAALPESAAQIPDTLRGAAGAPTAALTAYQSIHPYVKAGQHVFINGGSGGTGTFGIQIAKLLGCRVTTTCSTSKAELCKSLGADAIIDYTKTDVKEELARLGPVFDLAVDNVGVSPPHLHTFSASFLRPEAALVLVGAEVTLASVANMASALLRPGFLGGSKNKVVPFVTRNSHRDLAQIADWIGEGKLKTVVDSVYKFEEAPAAYEHVKKGSCAGKVIVQFHEA
ncbi:reticulon-4-interacting protein 1 [Purpureocillium lavendulum]|uniref:Reticulon-4-interacting protein 1 n=1 Tax=Purpureocillium lavendulum TaxID=1247861 RepID=A0AB34G5M0_9HYPO|nr:reticulon-4-interacting protein 1 [Purpureocillium lavendulum]